MTDQQPSPPKSEKIRITISLDPDTGAMFVTGPTHNKLLCAHILADALKSIMDAKISALTVPAGRPS